MASVNKATILGRLGNDPDIHTTQSGNVIANISVATSEKWKDKQTGNMQERTEWHRVVFFRKLAEIVQQYLRKGSQVYIEGSLRTNKWQDKNGIDRYTTEIIAQHLVMLGDGGQKQQVQGTSQQSGNQQPQTQQQKPAQPVDSGYNENVPF